MPVCQKCNVYFPNWIKVDGVNKSLSSRKYCLICSPWGKHNTKSIALSSSDKRKEEKYNWSEIQTYYDQGNTLRECQDHFGFGNTAFAKACKRGVFKLRNPSIATELSVKKGRRKLTVAAKSKLSQYAKLRGLGGIPRKKAYYNGIRMDSTYEVRVAQILDKHKINWIRPTVPSGGIPWVDPKGVNHSYYADFYLPEYNMYLDPKNPYYIGLHSDKIKAVVSQNNVIVKIIPLSLIKKWEKTGFDIVDLQNGFDIEDFDLTPGGNKVN